MNLEDVLFRTNFEGEDVAVETPMHRKEMSYTIEVVCVFRLRASDWILREGVIGRGLILRPIYVERLAEKEDSGLSSHTQMPWYLRPFP